jgi:hypothetical protein
LSLPLYLVPAAICFPTCYLPHSTKHVPYTHTSATLVIFLEVTTATHISVTSRSPFIAHGCPISVLCFQHFISMLTNNLYSFPQFLFRIVVRRLLASSRPSVRPSAWITSAPTGQITVKFDTRDLFVNFSTESQTG